MAGNQRFARQRFSASYGTQKLAESKRDSVTRHGSTAAQARAADKVMVLCVDPKSSTDGHGAEPGADVANWLARHGVKFTVQRDVAADSDVGSVILSRAAMMST